MKSIVKIIMLMMMIGGCYDNGDYNNGLVQIHKLFSSEMSIVSLKVSRQAQILPLVLYSKDMPISVALALFLVQVFCEIILILVKPDVCYLHA